MKLVSFFFDFQLPYLQLCDRNFGSCLEFNTIILSTAIFNYFRNLPMKYNMLFGSANIKLIYWNSIIYCALCVPEEFDNYMQQDAHEFLNFLINHINEIILGK